MLTVGDRLAGNCCTCPALPRQTPCLLRPLRGHHSVGQDVRVRVAQPANGSQATSAGGLAEQSGSLRMDSMPGLSSSSDTDGEELAVALASVANDVKGGDITVLHIAPLVYWTSYLVLVTVFSRPQLQAVLARMERRGAELGCLPSVGAAGRSAWEVLDFGSVVCHVMTAEQREYYDLESFYGAAEEVCLPFAREEQRTPSWTRQF